MRPKINDPELRRALSGLFGGLDVPEGLLGLDRPLDRNGLPALDERPAALIHKLEDYIKNMAAELEELGPDQGPRLKSEASGLLIALRELRRYFRED